MILSYGRRIALQGLEETRHGRLIACLVQHYGIAIEVPELPPIPERLGSLFTDTEQSDEKAFTATGANSFMDDLTPELFLNTCLAENAKRMSKAGMEPHYTPFSCQIIALTLTIALPHYFSPILAQGDRLMLYLRPS